MYFYNSNNNRMSINKETHSSIHIDKNMIEQAIQFNKSMYNNVLNYIANMYFHYTLVDVCTKLSKLISQY